MPNTKVLVVDDEQSVATTIKAILELDGNDVTAVTSGKAALEQLRQREFDVVLTDLRLDDLDGVEILRETQRLWPDTVSIMLTGYASLESAVAAARTTTSSSHPTWTSCARRSGARSSDVSSGSAWSSWNSSTD